MLLDDMRKKPGHGKSKRASIPITNPFSDVITLDPADFRVPAKDQNGNSSRVWANIQPRHARQIEAYIASRDLAYQTTADFLRHAVKNQLAWLHSLKLPVYSVWGQAELILRMSRDAQEEIEFENVFKAQSATVGQYMAADNLVDAKAYLSLCAGAIRDMNNGPSKDRYKAQFTKQFGPYLRATKSQDLMGVMNQVKLIKGPGGEGE